MCTQASPLPQVAQPSRPSLVDLEAGVIVHFDWLLGIGDHAGSIICVPAPKPIPMERVALVSRPESFESVDEYVRANLPHIAILGDAEIFMWRRARYQQK